MCTVRHSLLPSALTRGERALAAALSQSASMAAARLPVGPCGLLHGCVNKASTLIETGSLTVIPFCAEKRKKFDRPALW